MLQKCSRPNAQDKQDTVGGEMDDEAFSTTRRLMMRLTWTSATKHALLVWIHNHLDFLTTKTKTSQEFEADTCRKSGSEGILHGNLHLLDKPTATSTVYSQLGVTSRPGKAATDGCEWAACVCRWTSKQQKMSTTNNTKSKSLSSLSLYDLLEDEISFWDYDKVCQEAVYECGATWNKWYRVGIGNSDGLANWWFIHHNWRKTVVALQKKHIPPMTVEGSEVNNAKGLHHYCGA